MGRESTLVFRRRRKLYVRDLVEVDRDLPRFMAPLNSVNPARAAAPLERFRKLFVEPFGLAFRKFGRPWILPVGGKRDNYLQIRSYFRPADCGGLMARLLATTDLAERARVGHAATVIPARLFTRAPRRCVRRTGDECSNRGSEA
jgi:hypothetical protein